MSLIDLLVHFANFLAPALAVGVLLAVIAPVLDGKWRDARAVRVHAAINCIVTVTALSFGLWYFGRDGKMATYSAMVIAAASSQWLQMLRR